MQSKQAPTRRSRWAVLSGEANRKPLKPGMTGRYIGLFIVLTFGFGIAIEQAVSSLGGTMPSILAILNYSLAAIGVGILFAHDHRRLPTWREFSNLVISTYGVYVLIALLFTIAYYSLIEQLPGGLNLWNSGLFLTVVLLLLFDFVLVYVSFRFPMRWAMLLYLKRGDLQAPG